MIWLISDGIDCNLQHRRCALFVTCVFWFSFWFFSHQQQQRTNDDTLRRFSFENIKMSNMYLIFQVCYRLHLGCYFFSCARRQLVLAILHESRQKVDNLMRYHDTSLVVSANEPFEQNWFERKAKSFFFCVVFFLCMNAYSPKAQHIHCLMTMFVVVWMACFGESAPKKKEGKRNNSQSQSSQKVNQIFVLYHLWNSTSRGKTREIPLFLGRLDLAGK